MFLGRPDGDWSGRHTKDLRSDRLVGWLRDLTKKIEHREDTRGRLRKLSITVLRARGLEQDRQSILTKCILVMWPRRSSATRRRRQNESNAIAPQSGPEHLAR
jgi:hypothetical protein